MGIRPQTSRNTPAIQRATEIKIVLIDTGSGGPLYCVVWLMSPRRVDIKAILSDPVKRKRLMIQVLIATQAREGRDLTWAEAETAYDRVRAEILGREWHEHPA